MRCSSLATSDSGSSKFRFRGCRSASTSAADQGCCASTTERRTRSGRRQTVRDRVSVGTMHLSKGLEFRAVAVMACDDEVLPLQARIEDVTDESDLEEVYDTERHLLYVACTRARDHLLVTGVNPASEFLEDLQGRGGAKNLESRLGIERTS